MEESVGIIKYANSAPSFSGILKQRFSDFVVREVDNDNNICYLNSINSKDYEDSIFTQQDDNNLDKAIAFDELVKSLTNIIGKELPGIDINEFKTFYNGCLMTSNDCAEDFVALPNLDKVSRTAIHGLFKGNLGKFIETEMKQIDSSNYIRFVALHKQKKKDNDKRKRKWPDWPDKVGKYLSFTLLKENIDTMGAVEILSRLSGGRSRIDYNGTKDKRGVTTQRCTIYQQKPTFFDKINTSQRTPYIFVGDFQYVNEPARLGNLAGNRFELVLRALTANETEVTAACSEIMKSGFINYFGLQRFGKGGARSHEIGRGIYKSNWEACVSMLFNCRDGDNDDIIKTKQLFQEQKYSEALHAIPNKLYGEKQVLRRLAQNPRDFNGAFGSMPRLSRLLCIHAYQSYIWNKAASERISRFGLDCVAGDLVALSSDALKADEDLDADASGINESGDRSNKSKKGKHDNSNREENSNNKKGQMVGGIRVLTDEDIASHLFSITDVVLPVPGWGVILPSNSISKVYNDLLAEDGLSMETFSSCNVQYRSRGVYRRLLERPSEFEWKIVSYSHPDEEIHDTELNRYREISSVTSNPPTADSSTNATSCGTSNSNESATKALKALKLRFTLSSGTYATMLLRELTKESTESQYQAQLTKKQS